MENRITDDLKNLKDKKEISYEQYMDLCMDLCIELLYSLAKVQKIVTDGPPSF